MGNLLFWAKVGLLLVGPFICLAGLTWNKAAMMLRGLGIDPGREKGYWVAVGGFGMFVAGIGLHYFGI